MILKENWLTQKPKYRALPVVIFLTFVVLALTMGNWFSFSHLEDFLKATPANVFGQHQYYRLWTSLFVHADASHLISNMILFVPILYLLSAYFGSVLWPLFAILIGGLINYLVLKTLPSDVALIGISGVDNWLGAVWLTLFYLVDRRENRRRRFAVALFVSLILFVPDTYRPGISYLSHFIGYLLGILSGVVFYGFKKKMYASAEVYVSMEEKDASARDVELLNPIVFRNSEQ